MHYLASVDPGSAKGKQPYFAEARFNQQLPWSLCSLAFVEFKNIAEIGTYYRNRPAQVIVAEGQRPGRATTKDIIGLANTSGACASQAHVEGVLLNGTSWKGGVAIDVMAERILAQLREAEVATFNYACTENRWTKKQKWDILHAVGIGLYYLGELKSARDGIGLEEAKKYGLRINKRK